jgi:hypothetical protein
MPTIQIFEDPMTPKKPDMTKSYSHPYVEDYLEIIAGYRTPNGKNNHSIFSTGEPIVNLARYDMSIVPSLADQTINQQKGYTDRQATLAVQLILKYERQLKKHGIDVAPVRTPQYRLPLRELDRSTRVWIENQKINLKFPFNAKLIDVVRTAGKESKGLFHFNREKKYYEAALTEWNLNWIYSFSLQNNFEIDKTVQDLMELITAAEANKYEIVLEYNDQQLCISNAESSLTDYVQNQLGGFELDNILTLCDYAPVLGYTVDREIEQDIISNLGTRFWSLCANRQLKVDTMTNHNLVAEIVDYAKLTNRFPIFVYEPDLSGKLHTEFNKFFPGAIITLSRDMVSVPEDVKVVYTNKIPKHHFARIPLMISSAGMLYGGDRQMWIQTAEKVVYFTKDVYNKNTKGPDICKLD